MSVLPITIISGATVDAGDPSPVQIVMPAVVISVVTAPVTIPIIPATIVISRSWRGNKAGNSECGCEHLQKKSFHKFVQGIERGNGFVVAKYSFGLI